MIDTSSLHYTSLVAHNTELTNPPILTFTNTNAGNLGVAFFCGRPRSR